MFILFNNSKPDTISFYIKEPKNVPMAFYISNGYNLILKISFYISLYLDSVLEVFLPM